MEVLTKSERSSDESIFLRGLFCIGTERMGSGDFRWTGATAGQSFGPNRRGTVPCWPRENGWVVATCHTGATTSPSLPLRMSRSQRFWGTLCARPPTWTATGTCETTAWIYPKQKKEPGLVWTYSGPDDEAPDWEQNVGRMLRPASVLLWHRR